MLLLMLSLLSIATAENNSETCYAFSLSEDEFTSPNFPNKYPPNVQCTRLIEAPSSSVIRLHFIEHFQLESDPSLPQSCGYDYLEIRDGQFGYSSLVNKICGSNPPIYIESSGTFLWLRFRTDANIEYGGFKVRVEFVKRDPPTTTTPLPCTTTTHLTLSSPNATIDTSIISPSIISTSLETTFQIDCTWIVHAPEDRKIFLQFLKYELQNPNDCEFNFVEIYGAKTELEGSEGRLKQFCSSDREYIMSPGNVLHLRFFSFLDREKELKSGLVAYFGVFRGVEGDQHCDPLTEIDCQDNTCIPESQKCDKIDNCKSRNDEEEKLCGGNKDFQLKTNILIIAFLGILLMSGMCSGLLLNVYRKIMQDRRDLQVVRTSSLHLFSTTTAEKQPRKSSSTSKSTSSNPPTVIMTTTPGPYYVAPKPYKKKTKDDADAVMEMRDSSCQTSQQLPRQQQQRPSDVLVWIK